MTRYRLWDSRLRLVLSSAWLLSLSTLSLVSTGGFASLQSSVAVYCSLVCLVLALLTLLLLLLTSPGLAALRNVSVSLAVSLAVTLLTASHLLPDLSTILLISLVLAVQAALPLLGGLGLGLATTSVVLHLLLVLYSSRERLDLVTFSSHSILMTRQPTGARRGGENFPTNIYGGQGPGQTN